MTVTNQPIDQVFAHWDRADSPGCALAVIQDGQIAYQRGYGQATLEYDAPITPTTIFHVASVSKQFTAFAIALLIDEGKLALDDDARRYVPELPDFGDTITIRHLIHHTSGLRDQWSLLIAAGWRMSDVMTTADILELVRNQRVLNFRPGTEFAECNTGYTLLAQVVERVSGTPFPRFCAQRIFEPLGMRDSHFHDDYTRVVKNRAYSYIPADEGGFRNAVLSYANAGATCLFTTVLDLARWDQNFYDAGVGGPAVIDLMQARGALNDGTPLTYAFGLHLGAYRGCRTVEHDGGDAGFRSMLMRFQDQHFSVALAGNVSDLDTSELAHRVADIYLAEQLAPAPQPTRGATLTAQADPGIADDAAARAGSYYCAATAETLMLEARAGKLVMPNGPGLELLPVGPDRYQLSVAPQVEFLFVTTAAGEREVHQLYGTDKPIIYQALRPATLTAEMLTDYAGKYYGPELDVIYTVSAQAGKLVLHQRKYGDAVMMPTIADGFKCALSDGMGFASSFDLLFQRDAGGGRVRGFTISAGRIRNLRFVRMESDPV